jgi:Na+/alanine symporter
MACGISATPVLDSSTQVVSQSVNLLGPLLVNTSFQTCQTGTAVTVLSIANVLVAFSTVLQVLVLANDGLA